MILSQLVFPPEEAAPKRTLYYRGQSGPISKEGILLLAEETVRFDTYFNAFFYGVYAKYTDVERIRVCLCTTGEIQLRLFALDSQNCESLLAELNVKGRTISTSFPEYALKDLPAGGALFLEVTAHSAQAYIHGGWYESSIEEQRVKVSAIICTYHREEYVYRNLRSIQEKVWEDTSCPIRENLDAFVVDNGGTIQAGPSPHVLVLSNKNCGGSGGFTRGLLEVCQSGEYTHVLLMDDDISFEPETLVRTLQFLKAAKDLKQPLCIGGQMLLEDAPTIQFESGSSYIKGRLCPNGQGLDLSYREALLHNTRDVPVQYNAWWYCCLPLAEVREQGLPLPLFIKTDDVEYGLRLKPEVVLLNGIGVWHKAFSEKYNPYLEYYTKRNEMIVSVIHNSGAGIAHTLWKLLRTCGRGLLSRNAAIIYFEHCACQDFLLGPDFLLQTDGEALHTRLMEAGKSEDCGTNILTEVLQLIGTLFRLILYYPSVRSAYQARWKELTTEEFWLKYLELDREETAKA